jgi:hypothetical protein
VTDYWFVLPLNPEPWAVGEAYVMRSGGKMRAAIGPNQQLRAYQEAVRETLLTDYHALFDPLRDVPLFVKGTPLQLTCYFWRQRAEYKTHQGATARKHEIDATNALKAIEDAFQKLLYHNDKDNLRVTSTMVTQDQDVTHPKIVVHLEPYLGFDPHEIPTDVWEVMNRVGP